MAAGMYTMHHIVGSSYGAVEMVNTIFYFEVVMSIIALGVYLKFFKGTSFNKPTKKPRTLFLFVFGVMIINLLIIAGMFVTQGTFSAAIAPQLLMVFVTTALVGFSEEMIYRGIALPALLETNSKVKAILLSSLLFASLHAVNVLGGMPVYAMVVQLVSTFLVGITFTCIALELKTIAPLIIFHGLWDFFAIASGYVGVTDHTMTTIQVAFEAVFGIVLLIVIKKSQPKKGKKTPLADAPA